MNGQGPDILFHITDENYQFYQPDKDGKLIISANPYFFKFSPDGWQDISVNNTRNATYWAVTRAISIPLAYMGDGGQVIKSIVYTFGTEMKKAYLTICSQQLHFIPGVEFAYWYKKEFRGNIDLSSFAHEGVKVTCTALEDGLPKYLKANEGVVLEIPMDDPNAEMVKWDGVTLKEKINYADITEFGIDKSFYGEQFFGGPTLLNSDGNSSGVIIQSEYLESVSGFSWADKLAKDNFLIQNISDADITFNLIGTVKLRCTGMVSAPPYAYRRRFLRSNQLIGNQNDYQVIQTPAMAVGQVYTQDYNISITLQPNEKLFIENIFFGASGSDVTIEFLPESKFKIGFDTRKTPTYVPHFTLQYVFGKLVEHVTEGKYTAATSAFLSRNKQILLTCGDAIRGLKDVNGNPSAIMKINLKKFFHFLDSLYAVGLIAIEKNKEVDIDEKKNLSDRFNRIRLASPETPPKITIRKDLMWNVLKIGYPEIKNDVGVLNGNEAFCCGYEWKINATTSPAEINKVSEIKTDCYEQEVIRITLAEKDTTDNKNDSGLYANYVEATKQPAGVDYPAHYRFDRSLNATATGLLEPSTVWNIPLSTKRMLLNNLGFLNSCMLKCDGMDIIYSTADKNNRMTAGGVVEKDNVPLGNGQKFFQPVSITMQTPAPRDILDLLNSNPLSSVDVEIGGNIFSGFLEKSGIVLAGRRVEEHEILLDETNDLTKLIDYYG